MNKKVLTSLIAIVAVAAISIAGTIAYFSDTETSQNNVFVAGTIDLKIDNSAYYNGYKCEEGQWTCEPWADYVVSYTPQGTIAPDRQDPTQALGPAQNNDTVNFVSLGYSLGINGELVLGFDNKILNGEGADLQVVETSYGNPTYEKYPEKAEVYVSKNNFDWTYIGTAYLDEELEFPAEVDWAKFVKLVDSGEGSTPDGYDVDAVKALHCGVADPTMLAGACTNSWSITDLESEHFFSIEDLKPGDHGKDIISLHVESNEAYACVEITNRVNNENEIIEPETGDTTPDVGELGDQIQLFVWTDNDKDGFFEPSLGEEALSEITTLNEFISVGFDSANGLKVIPGETEYMGMTWCAGTLTVDETWGMITCDGSGMTDVAQSDSFVGDLVLTAIQTRNNNDFTCYVADP